LGSSTAGRRFLARQLVQRCDPPRRPMTTTHTSLVLTLPVGAVARLQAGWHSMCATRSTPQGSHLMSSHVVSSLGEGTLSPARPTPHPHRSNANLRHAFNFPDQFSTHLLLIGGSGLVFFCLMLFGGVRICGSPSLVPPSIS
jgi:hypothetical protein